MYLTVVYIWVHASAFTFSWSQDVCIAETTNKDNCFERVQGYWASAQVLHGDIPNLHTHLHYKVQ